MTNTIPTEQVVDLEVERARRLGYDLLKTYLYLPSSLQKRAIEGAHRIGIPISSHELYPAALFGADSVEHARAHDRRAPTSSKRSLLGRAYEDLIQIVAKSGMTFTPTLGLYDGLCIGGCCAKPSLAADTRMRRLQLPVRAHEARGQREGHRRPIEPETGGVGGRSSRCSGLRPRSSPGSMPHPHVRGRPARRAAGLRGRRA